MFKANLLFVLLLQLDLNGFGRPNHSFMAAPKSAIVRLRAIVSLECAVFNSTNSVFWNFIKSSNSSEKQIYDNREITTQLKSRYRINNESRGHYDLVIDSVDHEHAGRYICAEFLSSSKAAAELTVIDSDPVCGMNVTKTTDRIVSLWCEIKSTGFLIPQMNWTKDNGALINDTTQSTTINGLTTTTSFVRLQLRPQENNGGERITIKCATSFMWKNGSKESVPHYEHVWNHTPPSENKPTVAGERKIISETISSVITGTTDADSNPRQLDVWIMVAGGGSIVIIILIILLIVFQSKKKNGLCKNSSSQSTSNPDVFHNDSLPPDESARAPVQYEAVIYAKVNKEPKKKEPKNNTETKTSSKTAQTKGHARIVGEDGTEYMDFSGVKQPETKKVQSKSPQFSQVELYAFVDHTRLAPPYPPNKR